MGLQKKQVDDKLKERFDEIKQLYLLRIDLIKKDLDYIREDIKDMNRKNDNNDILGRFLNLSEEDRKGFNVERKNEKYAGLVMELAATLEHFLKELYYLKYNKNFVQASDTSKKKLINKLKSALEEDYKFSKSVDLNDIYHVRNKIAHEEYSMKSGKHVLTHSKYKKKKMKNEMKKSSDILYLFIEDAEKYINILRLN